MRKCFVLKKKFIKFSFINIEVTPKKEPVKDKKPTEKIVEKKIATSPVKVENVKAQITPPTNKKKNQGASPVKQEVSAPISKDSSRARNTRAKK